MPIQLKDLDEKFNVNTMSKDETTGKCKIYDQDTGIIQQVISSSSTGIKKINEIHYRHLLKYTKNQRKSFLCLDGSVGIENTILHITISAFETDPIQSGIGSTAFQMLMEFILQLTNFLKQKEIEIKNVHISGLLSGVDKENGNWNTSLKVYNHFAEKYDMNFYIKEKETGKIYTDYNDFKYECNEGNFHMIFTENTADRIKEHINENK